MESFGPVDYTLLLGGLAILAAVLIMVVIPNLMPTARGRLIRQRRELRHRSYQYAQAVAAAQRAKRKYESMKRREAKVKPKLLREAEETAKDLETMVGHTRDKVMVAENHVRKIILDEFPPQQQEKLLKRYAPQTDEKAAPFGF